MEPQLTPEGRGGPPLSPPGMARPPGAVVSKQGLRQDGPVSPWDPASSSSSSSERIPEECDQNVSDGGDLESVEPALVEVDGTTAAAVIHEGDTSTLRPNAAPPHVVLSDDLGLLSTLFGSSDEELAKPGVAPEGPEDDVNKGRTTNSTAAVEGGNRDGFGASLPKSDVSEDPTQRDNRASVPLLPPRATPLTAPARDHADDTGGPRLIDLPRIVKLKPSSITFSDYSGPDHADSDYNRAECTACNSCRPVLFNLCSDGGGSSQEEEEEEEENNDDDDEEEDGDDDDEDHGDEDVFLDHGAGPRCRGGAGRERRRRKLSKEAPGGAAGHRPAERGTDCDASPWCESMSQLMKKLDQLNVDIEEALSAGSSPSHTPAPARRRQVVSTAGSGAGVRRAPAETLPDGAEPEECLRPDGPPRRCRRHAPAPPTTRTRSRRSTMFSKTTSAGSEIEAKEACDWLRAAGFPQYAQLFEDSQFPIDISPVKRDHDFLEKDLVEPLCRRLITLNKCASMKLDVNLPRKKSEDSDEEDVFAISDRWTFEWTSRRWSRLQDIDGFLGHQEGEGLPNGGGGGAPLKAATSSESVLTDLSEPEVSSLHSESSGGGSSAPTGGPSTEDSDGSNQTGSDSAVAMPDPTAVGLSHISRDGTGYGSLPRRHARLGRARAKDFLKRMETLRSRGALTTGSRKTPSIGAPVLQDPPPPGLKSVVRCVDIVDGEMPPQPPPPPPSGVRTATSQSTSEGSSSCASSGSAASTPSLKERKAATRADHKRSGMYLEDLDIFSSSAGQVKRVAEQNRRNEFCSHEDLVVHIPKDHKPGTFPKALSIESLSPTVSAAAVIPNGKVATTNWHQAGVRLVSPATATAGPAAPGAKEPRPMTQCCSRGSRISVYDNVPGSHLYASTGDLIDMEKEDLFPHLDDILLHVNGLQQIVDRWSQNVLPPAAEAKSQGGGGGGVRGGGGGGGGGDTGSGGPQSSGRIALDFEADAAATEGQRTPTNGEEERDQVSLAELEGSRVRERRDSGVGASLTRPRRLRWPSFQIANRLSLSVASLQITNQSAGQLSLLQKFSLLRLTATMEKYSMSNRHGWTWSVPKFMKRMKVPDYKDKNVFGVPLIVHVQRSGQPLPLSLQQALRYLRSQCLDQVGLFRKSGVKSRIQALRQMTENSPDNVNYQDQSAYDVADMVKQFFRDLPEPLLTSKLGETFLHIYQYVSKDQRLQAVQAAIMLMSDENREVLQTLLCFLSDVTSSVEENQMTPMNIAVCLAPSLFHLNLLKKDNLSPRALQKKYATGRPDQKDLNENLAATQGLAHMITECNRLFEIPHEMVTQSRNSYVEADLHAPTLSELCRLLEEDDGSLPTHMETRLQSLLREARERSKYWVSCSSSDNTELCYKKVGDGSPLRRWRVSVEVEAPPSVVLNRVLRERHLWDVDLLQWKVTETLDRQTEVFQYVLNRMPPHPSRDFVVIRSWRTDLAKGACSLVSASVEREDGSPLLGGVRAVALESGYLLEPCGSGKSRLTHICRVDLKGRTPDWYNKVFGHICAAEVARIRNSFQPIVADGPETKI